MAVLCALVQCDGPGRFPCGTFSVWPAPLGAFLWDAVNEDCLFSTDLAFARHELEDGFADVDALLLDCWDDGVFEHMSGDLGIGGGAHSSISASTVLLSSLCSPNFVVLSGSTKATSQAQKFAEIAELVSSHALGNGYHWRQTGSLRFSLRLRAVSVTAPPCFTE